MNPSQQILQDFQQYLISARVLFGTRKNYLSDIGHFFAYLSSQNQYVSILTIPFILSSDLLEKYRHSLNSLPVATANRRLSALRKFYQFAFDSKRITQSVNSFPKNFPPNLSQIVSRYKKHLLSQNISPHTIKNYLSDINMHPSAKEVHLSISTLKRRQSSLNRFFSWQKHISNHQISKTTSDRFLLHSFVFASLCLIFSLFLLFKSRSATPLVLGKSIVNPFSNPPLLSP